QNNNNNNNGAGTQNNNNANSNDTTPSASAPKTADMYSYGRWIFIAAIAASVIVAVIVANIADYRKKKRQQAEQFIKTDAATNNKGGV
ncbi:MAG: hypothetical protein FWF11_03900, partial [Coriobacteriia bacterium]|nr:hypothetical protein [Coriobacteriia bacterium]